MSVGGDPHENFLASQLGDLKASVERVHERIDRHAERNDRNFERMMAKQDTTNGRVTHTEKRLDRLIGGMTVAAIVAGYFVQHFLRV